MRWFALFLAACTSSTDSPQQPITSSLPSSSLAFPGAIESNGLEVLVDVRPGLIVGGGDELFVEATGAARLSLVPFGVGRVEGYVALLATPSDVVTFGLSRASGTEQASVQLPPAFTIHPPPNSASRSTPMTWTWNADPSNATTLTFSGCGTSPRALGTDLGTFTLQPADFRATSTCAVELTITRQQLISASAAFPRATLAARQKRTVIVETTP